MTSDVATIVSWSLRSVVAALCVGVVLAVARPQAAARHAAWTAVLIVMLVMPALVAVAPQVPIPLDFILTTRSSRPAAAAGAGNEDAVQVPRAVERGPAPTGANSSAPVAVAPIAAIPDRAVAPVRENRWNLVWVLVYSAGLFVLLGRLGVGWRAARRLVAESRATGDDPSVRESPTISTPVTVGVIRPCILLPLEWRTWTTETFAAVLAHERAHIRRRDVLVRVIAQLTRALYWFNPLAWWLHRTTTRLAELAADESAIDVVGDRRTYAEALLAMARLAASERRRRTWQVVGIGGARELHRRIDRVLARPRSDSWPAVRRAVVSCGTAMGITLAVACAVPESPAPPLKPNAQTAEQLRARSELVAKSRAAWALTPSQVAALQQRWDANPSDLDAAERLLLAYEPLHDGKWMSDAPTWVEPRRRIVLWLIAHQPESRLIQLARLAPVKGNGLPDAEGYQQAQALWRAQLAKADVTSRSLANAAATLRTGNPVELERILLRGRARDSTDGRWTDGAIAFNARWVDQLGELYAQAIAPRELVERTYTSTLAYQLPQPAPATVQMFADRVRHTLDESTDVALLAATGAALMRMGSRAIAFEIPSAAVFATARTLLQRAIQIDPDNVPARVALHQRDVSDKAERRRTTQIAPFEAGKNPNMAEAYAARYASLATMPERERASELTRLSADAYLAAEYLDYTADHPDPNFKGNKQWAQSLWRTSEQAAKDALVLSPALVGTDGEGTVLLDANLAMGLAAARRGDRSAAVSYLTAAAAGPASDEIRYGTVSMLDYRLTDTLLDSGERETVARFYDQMAVKQMARKSDSLAAAAAIRAGEMPEGYQRRHQRRN